MHSMYLFHLKTSRGHVYEDEPYLNHFEENLSEIEFAQSPDANQKNLAKFHTKAGPMQALHRPHNLDRGLWGPYPWCIEPAQPSQLVVWPAHQHAQGSKIAVPAPVQPHTSSHKLGTTHF